MASAILQRVLEACVSVDGLPIASINRGLLIFLGIRTGDGPAQMENLAAKIAGLRIFEDLEGRMNLSCEQVGGDYLIVSQFTLCADLSKGKRPSFDNAMKPPASEQLYLKFCERLATLSNRPVKTGKFGVSMVVSLKNDGPATFRLDADATNQRG